MSVQQDRLTFFGVLIAVVVVVIGYLQLGQMYPVTGRADTPAGDLTQPKDGDDTDNPSNKPSGDSPGQSKPPQAGGEDP